MTEEIISQEPEKYSRGQHPNSKANLKIFQPGHAPINGNPEGSNLTTRLRKALDNPRTTPGEEATVAELIIDAAIEGAIKREPTPTNLVWDRIDGKMQDQPAGGNDNRQINIIVKDGSVKELVESIGDRFLGEDKE